MQDLRSRIAVAMTRSPKTSPQSAEALKTTPDDFQDPGTRAAVRARRCKPGHPAVQQHSPRRAGGRPVTRRLYLSATCSEPLSMVFLSRDLDCIGHRSRATTPRNLSIGMSRHGPLAHPRSMKISYHSPAAARATSRCLGTSASVMSLTWELSAPRIVAFEHAEQSRA